MNRSNLMNIEGVEIVGEGKRKAYFFGEEVIEMEDEGLVSIRPTKDDKVSEIYNEMLLETGFEHYLYKEVNYLVDPENERSKMSEAFSMRVKETL